MEDAATAAVVAAKASWKAIKGNSASSVVEIKLAKKHYKRLKHAVDAKVQMNDEQPKKEDDNSQESVNIDAGVKRLKHAVDAKLPTNDKQPKQEGVNIDEGDVKSEEDAQQLKQTYKQLKKDGASKARLKEAKSRYKAAAKAAANAPAKTGRKRPRPAASRPSPPSFSSSEVNEYRVSNHIIVTGDNSTGIAPCLSFASAPFHPTIQHILTASYVRPTPVQAQSWPIIQTGRDLVSVAKTGSGKTCAFLVPLLNKLAVAVVAPGEQKQEPEPGSLPSPIGLVLAPVRELAIQINEVALQYTKSLQVRTVCLYGGAPKWKQMKELLESDNAFPHIIVATPGRLLDLCTCKPRGTSFTGWNGKPAISLDKVEYFVLDEADRMLDLGFQSQLQDLSNLMRHGHQTIFFSATWPQHVQRIASAMATDPVHVRIGGGPATGAGGGGGNNNNTTGNTLVVQESIEQIVMVMHQDNKSNALRTIILKLKEHEGKTIVFLQTKKLCDDLVKFYRGMHKFKKKQLKQLQKNKLRHNNNNNNNNNVSIVNIPYSAALHGNLPQKQRMEVLNDFRSSKVRLLFATDVAARGLDIVDVNLVVNYDFPVQRGEGGVEEYVHRIGRTGRGEDGSGKAITFFTKDDADSAGPLVNMLLQHNGQIGTSEIPSELLEMAKRNASVEGIERLSKRMKRYDGKGRPGDWTCSSCNATCFARKTECFKCGALKS